MQRSSSLTASRSFISFWVLLAFVVCLTALTACKQGLGDVCQIDGDCEDGLICNSGNNLCEQSGGGDGDGDGD
jgi:hypothetical protein